MRLTGGLPAAGPVPAVRETHAVRAAPAQAAPRDRRRPPQGVLLGLGLAALLLVGGTAGWLSGRSPEQALPVLPSAAAAPSAATASPARTDWADLLDGLDAARAQAFAAGDVAALAEVYAPGSPGLASDTALLQSLVDRRQTAHGLRHEVRSVDVLAQEGDTARLRVVDVLAPYEVRDAGGAVVSRAPARGEQPFLVSLTRTAAGWRLVEVRPEA